MDENSIEKAKALFFRYQGNFFYMSREGEYEEYKGYSISKEQELVWKDELVTNLLSQLSFSNTLPFQNLAMIAENYKDYSIVETLIKYVSGNLDKGDSLIKLVYAEVLLNIPCPKELMKIKVDTVTDLLQNVSNNPITVEPGWTKKGFHELPDKEYIITRLNNDFKRVTELKQLFF